MVVSIPAGLRWVLILASLGILIFVIYSSAKSRMNVRYAVVWITWAVFVLIVAVWPGVAMRMANLTGVQSVTNFILLFMTAILFLLNYFLYMQMSRMDKNIRRLNYELSLLRQKKDEEEEKKTEK